jgi:hypothetical protein
MTQFFIKSSGTGFSSNFNYLKMTPPVMLGGSLIFLEKKLQFQLHNINWNWSQFQFPLHEDNTSCAGWFFPFVRSKEASVQA